MTIYRLLQHLGRIYRFVASDGQYSLVFAFATLELELLLSSIGSPVHEVNIATQLIGRDWLILRCPLSSPNLPEAIYALLHPY